MQIKKKKRTSVFVLLQDIYNSPSFIYDFNRFFESESVFYNVGLDIKVAKIDAAELTILHYQREIKS